jgi:tRNA (guanine37-N1)-methyltransferase
MKLSCVTLFPELIEAYFQSGLMKKAKDQGLIQVEAVSLRNYAEGNYKSVDDKVYGGGDGQLIQYGPLKKAKDEILFKSSSAKKPKFIYLSPQGQKLDETLIQKLQEEDHLVLISGRYAGVDQRFVQSEVDLEVSIGDYVLNGGELPSLVLIEALTRKISGVLGNELSSQHDTFSKHLDGLLEAPQFTKPSDINGHKVP